MKFKYLLSGLILITVVILAACSPKTATTGAIPEPAEEISEGAMADTDDAMESDTETDEMASQDENMAEHSDDSVMEDMDDDEGMVEDDVMSDGSEMADESEMSDESEMTSDPAMVPEWFKADLVEARSGETFRITDYKGKVVLVETMAMWCSNCMKQQRQVKALHEMLGERDDFIGLGIDVDLNENVGALKVYIENNGFDWRYIVAPKDVAVEIGQLYGNQFLNPSSTPILIIDRHGEVHPLPFGIKSADSLLDSLKPFLDEGM
jgi:thiol-disulfide isomerase/thioredoxin